MKTSGLPPVIRPFVLPVVGLVLAMMADMWLLTSDRWNAALVPLGLLVFLGLSAVLVMGYLIGPLLEWSSPAMLTPFDGAFSVAAWTVVKSTRPPLVVVALKEVNVPSLGIVSPKPGAYAVLPGALVQRVGQNYFLHGRLLELEHDFGDFPEVHDALVRCGYDNSPMTELYFCPFATLGADRTLKALDVRALAEASLRTLDEHSELARKVVKEFERKMGDMRAILGRK